MAERRIRVTDRKHWLREKPVQSRKLRRVRDRAIAAGTALGAIGLGAAYGRRLVPSLTRVIPQYVVKSGAVPKVLSKVTKGSRKIVTERPELAVKSNQLQRIHTHERLPTSTEARALGNRAYRPVARALFGSRTQRTRRGGGQGVELVKSIPFTTRATSGFRARTAKRAARFLERNLSLWNVLGKQGGMSRLAMKLQNAENRTVRSAVRGAQRLVERPFRRKIPKAAYAEGGEISQARDVIRRTQGKELERIRSRLMARMSSSGARPRKPGDDLNAIANRRIDWIVNRRARAEVSKRYPSFAERRVKGVLDPLVRRVGKDGKVRGIEAASERLGRRLANAGRRLGADVPVKVESRRTGIKRTIVTRPGFTSSSPISTNPTADRLNRAAPRRLPSYDDSLPENGGF